jgi:hypothetical protein
LAGEAGDGFEGVGPEALEQHPQFHQEMNHLQKVYPADRAKPVAYE